MFQHKCPECWNWFINFFDPSLADTSLESLFKYLIILLVAVIILYGVFSVIAYASSAAANFARKVTAPVASLVLVIFMLIVVSQLRNGKTCRFEEEKYLTQCIPKKERNVAERTENTRKSTAGRNSWDDPVDPPAKGATKNSWDKPKEPAQRNSWDESSSPPSKSTTKSMQSDKAGLDENSETVESDKSCASKKGAQKQECMNKERDYSGTQP